MSSILVCINNNLQYDMRVLRQVETFSTVFDKVIVCARPLPDRTIYFHAANVEWMWFENQPVQGHSRILELSKKYGLYDQLVPFAPVILDDYYAYTPEGIEFEIGLQEALMSHPRWDEVRHGIPAESPPNEQFPWVVFNLDLFLQWAEFTSGIDADVIYCNDFDTLLCGVIHKKIHASRFVYDEHDIYPDAFPRFFPLIYRYFIAQFEYAFLRNADMLISVGDAYLEWTVKTYRLTCPTLVVPNCKDVKEDFPVKCKMDDSPLRLYYHGIAGSGRGIEEVVKAVGRMDGVVLCLRCFENEFLTELRHFVKSNALESKVLFFDPVSVSEVISAANADGDIGLSIMGEETSIGLRGWLPNKFIEYLAADMPVIVSAGMRDQESIVKKYDAGFVIDSDIENGLRSVAEAIQKDPDLLRRMSVNAKKASQEVFNFETYKNKFIDAVTGDGEENLAAFDMMEDVAYDDLKSRRDILENLMVSIMENRRDTVLELHALKKEYTALLERFRALELKYGDLENQCSEICEKPSANAKKKHWWMKLK